MLCYQILHGRCDTAIANCFVHRSDDSTRGNQLKLYKCHCTVDFTKHYFANRVVNVWNSLPDTVVTAPSLLSFRRQLAKFDLSGFVLIFIFLNFFLYIFFYVVTIVLTVLSMYFIGVSGLRVLPLLIYEMK